MVAIAVKALVVGEPNSMFLCHCRRRFRSGSFGVVHNLRLTRALAYVRVDVKETPEVSFVKVPEKSSGRSLIAKNKDDVLELHDRSYVGAGSRNRTGD